MKRLKLATSILAVGTMAAYAQTSQEASVTPTAGFVPDAETAVKIGEAMLVPVYGEKQIHKEKPFRATREGDVWTVTGSLSCGGLNCNGGTAVVRISKTSEEILFMFHYK